MTRSYAGSSASSTSSNISLPSRPPNMPPGPPPSRAKKARPPLAALPDQAGPDSPWAPPPLPPRRIRTPPRPQLNSAAKSAPPPVHGYPRTPQDRRHLKPEPMPLMPTLQLHAPKAIRPVPAAKSALKGWEQTGPGQQACFFAKRYIVKEEHPYNDPTTVHYHLEAEAPFTPADTNLARQFAVMSIMDELNCATLRRICEVYEDPKAWVVIKNREIIDIVCKRAEAQMLYGSELVLK